MFKDDVRRLRVLIFARALVVTLLLGSFYIFQIGYGRLLFPAALSYLIAALYALTIIYAVTLKWIRTARSFFVFAYVQILVDIAAESTLIYLTGTIESWFSFTFLLSIISASILLNRRASFYAAAMSSLLYGLLNVFQFYEILNESPLYFFASKDYLYNVFANITAFYLTALLSGYLSERLRAITQTLKERDADLSDLKALSRDIVESMPSGVFTADLTEGIITFNSSARKITGWTDSEAMGKNPEDIFPFLKGLDIKAPDKRIEGEMLVRGEKVYIGIRFSTLKDSTGTPLGIIGIFQDLTSLKALEFEIKKKEKMAFIGELSALIAHELRNPLASLKASIEMLRENKIPEQHAAKLMEIALSEMDRLDEIVVDFLIYARPAQLNKSSFDLHKSLRDVITLLKNSKTNRGNVRISENFDGELFVEGDAKQLHQVFWNLGVNAIDAVFEKGEVAVSTNKRNGAVEIAFYDTGVGIRKEDIDKIFYPFFTTKIRGTGLGLAIAQRITEEHGGKITVRSGDAMGGTLFTVTLPQGREVNNAGMRGRT